MLSVPPLATALSSVALVNIPGGPLVRGSANEAELGRVLIIAVVSHWFFTATVVGSGGILFFTQGSGRTTRSAWLAAALAFAASIFVTAMGQSKMENRARRAWLLATAMLLSSVIWLVSLMAASIPPGLLRVVLEYGGLFDVVGLLAVPITIPYAGYVLVRYRGMGWTRWFTLLGLVIVRVLSVIQALDGVAAFARMHA
jgi:hypothetical protein